MSADFIPSLEHREGVEYKADGDAGGGASQEVPRTGQHGENGGMSF